MMQNSTSKQEPTTDLKTVEGFGDEWAAFDQQALDPKERQGHFEKYFSVFPFHELSDAEGFDLGCGSGRWAALAAKRVGHLNCIDPAEKALAVARSNLKNETNVSLFLASSDNIPLADNSQGFGYSLGVLHHTPDTELALAKCVAKLKPGAPFLLYLYYSLDNQPRWFRLIWQGSDLGRRLISRLPFKARRLVSEVISGLIYWPLARSAKIAEKLGRDVRSFPLSHYRTASFYTMRTDALDRFGTRLEKRFSRAEIDQMMRRCGLTDIVFRDAPPFWCACGRKGLN